MIEFPPTIVLRHHRENLKKCSLSGLEKRSDFLFFTYPHDELPDLASYVLLKIEAPPLTSDDAEKGLFLIDGTWRLTNKMEKNLSKKIETRCLPSHYQTAYPRRQTDCPDPKAGLASIEALFIAYFILKRPLDGLLQNYHWKDLFLERNKIDRDLNC